MITKGAMLVGATRSRACKGAAFSMEVWAEARPGGNCPPAPLGGPSLDNNSLAQLGDSSVVDRAFRKNSCIIAPEWLVTITGHSKP
jgi:hypothetical protein